MRQAYGLFVEPPPLIRAKRRRRRHPQNHGLNADSYRWQGNPIRPWNLRRKKSRGKNPSERGIQDTAA